MCDISAVELARCAGGASGMCNVIYWLGVIHKVRMHKQYEHVRLVQRAVEQCSSAAVKQYATPSQLHQGQNTWN